MTAPRVTRSELACLSGLVAAGALLRFANLGARGGWDADQGSEMLALRTAISAGQLPTFGPQSASVAGTYHHGALYYDLLLPAAWLGNGDPLFVAAEIALLGLLVIPIVWWIGRTAGGVAAGLIAAALATFSASLIGYSTMIWNPTLLEPGAALAILGTWQAWRTSQPRWWIVAAIGMAVAMQAHMTSTVLAIPIGIVFVAAVRRAPSGKRRAILLWGAASVALVVVTYLPLILYELGHDFGETRAVVAYFTAPSSESPPPLPLQLLLASIRILSWPLTSWPQIDLRPAFPVAFAIATGLFFGLMWLAIRVRRERAVELAAGSKHPVEAESSRPAGPDDRPGPADRRDGLAIVGLALASVIVVPGLAVRGVAEFQALPTEQYHAYADPLVLIATGLVLAEIWRTQRAWHGLRLGRLAVAVALIALLAWNVPRWPPLTAPDGGYPAAVAAAERVEVDARGSSVAFLSLPADKLPDAYVYPLTARGATFASLDRASTVVILCDSFWIETGCGDPGSEAAWLSQASAGGGLQFVERFVAAPDRTLSVYRRAP